MGLFDMLFGDGQQGQTQPQDVGFGQQLNGLPPQSVAPPPQNPEELVQRKGQWGQFLDRINSDPNMQLAVLRMGTNLMQPVQPGQTTAGHLGRSLDDSVSYLGNLRELERKRKQDERELVLKEQRGAADIGHTQAQTDSTRQTTSQRTTEAPNRLKTLQEELRKLENENTVNTPERLQKVATLRENLLNAQIEQATAHAQAYRAAAGVNDSKGRKVQTVKLDDGTAVTVTTDSSGTYYTRMVPPRFNSVDEARAAAEKKVKQATPWFFGKPTYEGTPEQEINRLVEEWTKPQIQHFDQNRKAIPALPPEPKETTANPALEKLVASPSQFDELFAAEEKRNGLPPGSLKRLAATESSLNPQAQNKGDGNGGSYGLMQINGVHLKGDLTPETIMDPATNIRKGAEIYAAALKKAGGDQQRAAEIYKGAVTSKGKASVASATTFVAGGQPSTATAPEVIKVEVGPDGKPMLPSRTGAKPTTAPTARVNASQEALRQAGKANAGQLVGGADEYKNERILEAQQLTVEKIRSLDRATARRMYDTLYAELSPEQKKALRVRIS